MFVQLLALVFSALFCSTFSAVPTVTYIPATPPNSFIQAQIDPANFVHFVYIASTPAAVEDIYNLTVTVVPLAAQNYHFNVSVAACGIPGYSLNIGLDQSSDSYSCVSDAPTGCSIEHIAPCTDSNLYFITVAGSNTNFNLTVSEVPVDTAFPVNLVGLTEITLASGLAYLTNQTSLEFNPPDNAEGTIYFLDTSGFTYPTILSLTGEFSAPGSSQSVDIRTGLADSCILTDIFPLNTLYADLDLAPDCGLPLGPGTPLPNPLLVELVSATAPTIDFQVRVFNPTLTTLTAGNNSDSVAAGEIKFFTIALPTDSDVRVTVSQGEDGHIIRYSYSTATAWPLPDCAATFTCVGLGACPSQIDVPTCPALAPSPSPPVGPVNNTDFGLRIAVKGISHNASGVDPAGDDIPFTILVELVPLAVGGDFLTLTDVHQVSNLTANEWHDFHFNGTANLYGLVGALSFTRNPNGTDFDPDEKIELFISRGAVRHDDACYGTLSAGPIQPIEETGGLLDLHCSPFAGIEDANDIYVSLFFEAAEITVNSTNSTNSTTFVPGFNVEVSLTPFVPIPLTLGDTAGFAIPAYSPQGLPTVYHVTGLSAGLVQVTLVVNGTADQVFTDANNLLLDFGDCGLNSPNIAYPANTTDTAVYTTSFSFCRSEVYITPRPLVSTQITMSVEVVPDDSISTFTPGQTPVTFYWGPHVAADFTEVLKFSLGTAQSIAVEGRGQSSSDNLQPFSLVLHSPANCKAFSIDCPGDSQPCFLGLGYEIYGAAGTWYLEVHSPSSGADGVWVNISLGADNCKPVFVSEPTDFCASEGISTTSVFGGFLGSQDLDFLPNLAYNAYDALPGATTACLTALKKFACGVRYRACDANYWITLRGQLCLDCRAVQAACASSEACPGDGALDCFALCDIEGSTGSADGGDGGDGDGGDGDAASTLRAFDLIL